MLKINGEVVDITHFPDYTKLIKCPIEDMPHRIAWYYEGDEEMFTLYALTKHLQQSKYSNPITLFLPYLPNARMDRTKRQEEVFTLKWFADFINSLGFEKVEILDPHSNVGVALIDRVSVWEPTYFINTTISKSQPDVIFFPDEGSCKRYSDLIKTCGPRAFGIKKRDWETGNILGLDIYGDLNALKGAKVLIIDDICSKGGTFYHSAKALKEAGAASVDLYVTHCEDTIFEGELLKNNGLIDRIYTTNSIFHHEHDKIEVYKLYD